MNAVTKDLSVLVGGADGRSAPHPGRPIVPPLLLKALSALNAAGLPYCYWKRAAKLEGALTGRSDLDLLVARRARDAFFAIMQSLGFKAWPDASALAHAEFVSFLGYDESSGLILHVHAHFRLLLGDALSKVFHIPIEEKIISRSRMDEAHPVRVLDPVDEMLLLRLRWALEGGWLDVVSWRRSRSAAAAPEACLPVLSDASALHSRAATILSPAAAQRLAATDLMEARSRAGLSRKLRRDLKRWRLCGPARAYAQLFSARLI